MRKINWTLDLLPPVMIILAFCLGLLAGRASVEQPAQQNTTARVDTAACTHETIYLEQQRREADFVAELSSEYGISADLAEIILWESWKSGIPRQIGFRLIQVESNFDAHAISSIGAIGLTQLRLSTARSVEPDVTRKDLIVDERRNVRIGFEYLRRLKRRYESWSLALLAYNRGPATVDRDLHQKRDPRNGYAQKVLN